MTTILYVPFYFLLKKPLREAISLGGQWLSLGRNQPRGSGRRARLATPHAFTLTYLAWLIVSYITSVTLNISMLSQS